jgi:hypothetical protein
MEVLEVKGALIFQKLLNGFGSLRIYLFISRHSIYHAKDNGSFFYSV